MTLVLPEIGGGRLDASHLATIADHPEAHALTVSGLDQPTFERLVTEHGRQFSAIEFWKCPRIADLSPLEDLPGLRLVSFYWNQRATRLWDLTRTPGLAGLNLDDFTRLHDLADLAEGTNLRELAFGDMIWSTSVYTTLEPVGTLTGLRSLAFSAKKIEDGRIDPLGHLTGLEELSFPTNLFTTRQVAWLRARLPETVTGRQPGCRRPPRAHLRVPRQDPRRPARREAEALPELHGGRGAHRAARRGVRRHGAGVPRRPEPPGRARMT